MSTARYTPGHSASATNFMAQRTFDSHGAFFIDFIQPGHEVLDCGCGPGSITHGVAGKCFPGKVTGIDFGESQIDFARQAAPDNATFQTADCTDLPFDDESSDRVFSHALMEHLNDPQGALAKFDRVLKPGGAIGVCSPDWSGFLLAPPSDELSTAICVYRDLQTKNGGDVEVGCKFGSLLHEAGFTDIQMLARYENYPSLDFIGEYLALQLDGSHPREAQALRDWAQSQGGMFAQAWVSATARKPSC